MVDKIIELLLAKLEKNGIRLVSSPRRWGVMQALLAIAIFWLALSPTGLALYLSYTGGKAMSPTIALVISLIPLAIGLLVTILAIRLGYYWLKHPSDDPNTIEFRKLNTNLNKHFKGLRTELRGIREDLKSKGKKDDKPK